jgi:hypothetical protein
MDKTQHQTETSQEASAQGNDQNWQVKPSPENTPPGSAPRTVIGVHSQGSEILGVFESIRAEIGAKTIEGTIFIAGKPWHCTISDVTAKPIGIKIEMQSGDKTVMVAALENGRLDFSNISVIVRAFFESILNPQDFKPVELPTADAPDQKDNTNGTSAEPA